MRISLRGLALPHATAKAGTLKRWNVVDIFVQGDAAGVLGIYEGNGSGAAGTLLTSIVLTTGSNPITWQEQAHALAGDNSDREIVLSLISGTPNLSGHISLTAR